MAVSLFLQSLKVTHKNHSSVLGRSMDSFLSQHDHFILMGDFNSEPDETMSDFIRLNNFKNLIKLLTCSTILKILLA